MLIPDKSLMHCNVAIAAHFKYLSGGPTKYTPLNANFNRSLALHCWDRVRPVPLETVIYAAFEVCKSQGFDFPLNCVQFLQFSMAISENFNSHTEQPENKSKLKDSSTSVKQVIPSVVTQSPYRETLSKSSPKLSLSGHFSSQLIRGHYFTGNKKNTSPQFTHKTRQKGLWLDSHKLPISGHFRSSTRPQLVRGHQASSSQAASAGTPGLDTQGYSYSLSVLKFWLWCHIFNLYLSIDLKGKYIKI